MASSIGERLGEMRGFDNNLGANGGARLKRIVGVIVALVVALVLLPNTMTYVNPGYVGIEISRIGGGVSPKPLDPGIKVRNPLTTDIVEYPIYMQTMVLTRGSNEGSVNNDEINVNSVEGQPLSLDVSMSFELDPQHVPILYQTFRTDIATIQHSYVKQAIRQSL